MCVQYMVWYWQMWTLKILLGTGMDTVAYFLQVWALWSPYWLGLFHVEFLQQQLCTMLLIHADCVFFFVSVYAKYKALSRVCYCYCCCLQGDIIQGAPYVVNITDLFCFPIWVPWFTHQSSLAVTSKWHLVAKQEETWWEVAVNLAYKYLFSTVGNFNMP
jgi:hypothetical protein